MLSAVMLSIVVALILVAVVSDNFSQANSAARHSQRMNSTDAADAGVHALQQAMYSQRNVQRDGFTVTVSDLQAAAALSGGTAVANTSTPFPTVHATGMGTTVRMPAQDGVTPNWQVYALNNPTAQYPWVTAYLRAWVQVGSDASAPILQRVRLRPGSMADYQLVSDAPIQLDPGITINGRVHSNGWLDETVQPPRANTNLRVWAQGAATCIATAGIQPTVSAAKGTVGVAGATGCTLRDATNKFVSLNTARSSVDRIRSRCGTPGVICPSSGGAAPDARARVDFSGTSVSVRNAFGTVSNYTTSPTQPMTLLFDRSVEVRGVVDGRVTVAAWSPTAAGAVAAPDIIVVGNVGRTTPTTTSARALGLLAEHDVVIDHVRGGCPQQVTAAMIAVSGGIVLPWDVRTPTMVPGAAVQCGPLSITGSLASHGTVALRWSWSAGRWTGYSQRTYVWDPWLAAVPPPYWPMTNPWEIIDSRTARGDCFTGALPLTGAECR